MLPGAQHRSDTAQLILDNLLDALRADLKAALALPDPKAQRAAIDQAVADFKNLYGRTPAQLAHWAGHAAKQLPAERAFAAAFQGVLNRAKIKLIQQLQLA